MTRLTSAALLLIGEMRACTSLARLYRYTDPVRAAALFGAAYRARDELDALLGARRAT